MAWSAPLRYLEDEDGCDAIIGARAHALLASKYTDIANIPCGGVESRKLGYATQR